jgi:predicted nucleic acid-binding Zn ribbon protein
LPFSLLERIIFVAQRIVMERAVGKTGIEEKADVQPMGRGCLHCGKALKGRVDKRFCDTGCKNLYHNRRQRAERSEIGSVDLVLKRNRRILKNCLGREGTRRVRKEELVARGFRFEYFTHNFTNSRGKRYCFCYDYGWLGLGGDQWLVVKQRDAGL